MMKHALYHPLLLKFIRPSGTSRGILVEKETFILEIYQGTQKGVGECALFRGLSCDDRPDYEEQLRWLCKNINEDEATLRSELKDFPSLVFGLEQALLNLKNNQDIYFPSRFTEGHQSIKTNGLIWMGTAEWMQEQIEKKISAGYSCLKLKIGVDWATEKSIITDLRHRFPKEYLEIRVDANGAFSFNQAQEALEDLSRLGVHSIEQPITAGDWGAMAQLCRTTPVPIALDEELIGALASSQKQTLLEFINPQYIILKPALLGGFSSCDEWISLAEQQQVGWWITSTLESNIGLHALAQYTFTKANPMPQGLGTGGLFSNNFPSRLRLEKDELYFH